MPITILSGGSTVIGSAILNQQLSPDDFLDAGVYWETVGVFNTTTNQLHVKMTDNTNGYAIADAVRIERVIPVSSSAIIDTHTPGFSKSGAWGTSSQAGAYGSTVSWSSLPSDGSEVAEWSFYVEPGVYRVSTSLHSGASIYGANNPVSIYDGSQLVGSLALNQSVAYTDYFQDSTWWKHLGTFSASSSLRIRMTDLGDGYLISDAFRIQKVAGSTSLTPPTSILIANPSFEAQSVADGAVGPNVGTQQVPITNWGYGLLLNPTTAHFLDGTATNGLNVTAAGSSGAYTLAQVLSHTPQSNKEYRLQVDVGDRLDRILSGWRVELRSNSTTLAWIDEKFFPVTDGRFTTAELVYTTSDTPPSGPLEIVLIGTSAGPNSSVSFDNVRLSMRESRFANPIANDDLLYYTPISTDLVVGAVGSLLNNDYSFEGIASTASILEHPTHGIVTVLNPDGTFIYRPDPGYVGVDTFTYRTHNGVLQSAPARVQISIGTKLLPKLNRDPNVFQPIPSSNGLGLGYSNIPVASSMDTDGALSKTGGLLLAEDVLPGLSMIYRTDELVRPIIEIESQFPPGQSVPATIDAQLTFNGTTYAVSTFSTTGFAPGDRFRLALQADASTLSTGRYGYQVNLMATSPNWSTSVTGSRVIINRSQSSFGSGWSLDGLDRLHEESDGLLLVRGKGDFLWFPKLGSTYGFAEGDTSFHKATKHSDGSYTLSSKDGFLSSFNSSGLLLSVRDRSGNTTSFQYSDQDGDSFPHELVSITEPYGRVISLGYTSGRVSSLQHYSGRVTSLSHVGNSLVGYTLTDPDGTGLLQSPSNSFQYTANQLTSRTNAKLETTLFGYNPSHGRLAQVTHPNGDQWMLEAEETIALPSGTTTLLKRPTEVYSRVTDGEGNLWQFQTDRFGYVTKSVTPLLNTRTYLRNANGQVYEAREPDPDKTGPGAAPVTRIGYSEFGDVAVIVSPDGGTSKIKYSERYRQAVLAIDPVGRTNRTNHDAVGNPVQSIDGAGFVTTRLFNTRGLETQVTTPDPDGTGPQTAQTTIYGYDAFGRLASAQNPDGSTNTYGYTSADELSDWTDELGKLTQWTFDALGRNTTSRNRINAIEQTQFDSLSRPIVSTNAIGSVTDVTYDSRGRIATISYPDPDGGGNLPRPQDVIVYDKNSNVVRQKNPDSNFVGELRYKFDSEDRMVGRSHSEYVFDDAVTGQDLSIYETYDYDDIGRVLRVNRVGRDRASSPLTQLEIGQPTPIVFYTYDSVGRIASKIHLSQSGSLLYQETYAYNPAGQLISRTDGQGNVALNVYDSRGLMIQETTADPDGSGPQFSLIKRYAYDALGRLSSVDRGFGRVTTIEYNNRNWPTKVTEPDPDGAGPLASPITQMGYDLRGDQSYSISPTGRVTYFSFDDQQRKVAQIDPDPDGAGPLAAPTYIWAYNAADWLLAEVNPRSAVTYYGYDSLGRPTTIVAPDPDDSGPLSAPTTYLTYDARGLVGVTDPLSRTTTFALDKAGRRIAVTDTANETTNYVYNFYDQVMSIASPDPDGVGPQARSIQTYEYDQNGRLSRSTDPKQKNTQYSYDFANNLRTITDPTNQTTTFDYDGLNRKIRETKTVATYVPNESPQSASRSFVYDVAGNLVRTVDRNGRLTQFLYDKLDRVVEEKWITTSQVSTSVSTLADGLKQDESQVVGWNAPSATNLSGTFRLTYNISQTAPIAWNADATTIRNALELLNGIGVGNVDVSVTAPTAFSRSIAINFKNSLAGQNAPQVLINVNSLVATGGGVSAIQQTIVNGATISEKQRLTIASGAGTSLAGVWYLGFGGEVSPPLSTTANAGTVRDTLNAFAGIDSVTVTGTFPTFDVTFGGTQSTMNMQEIRVDAANVHASSLTLVARTISSNYNAEDELLSISDPSATINFTRDALGRATSIQNVLGTYAQTNFTFHQSFDVASNRTSLRAVHGTSNDFLNTYNYDKLDRLIEVTQSGQAGGASVLPKRVSIAYNALGQRTQIDRFESTGVSHPVAATSYSYDYANRLSRIEHKKGATVFNAHDYLFDRMSRISSVTSVDGTVDYTYDPLSQLLSADDGTSPLQATSQTFDFTYDDNGNRTNSGYTTPVDDRVQTAPGSESYRYDLEGNIIKVYGNNATARTLTWDHRNRLTRAVVYSGSGNITVDYEYDAFNRLVKRTQSGTSNTTYFGYDEGINPHLQFESNTGQISHRYLWSDQVDELFADEQKLAGTGYDTFWTLGDHQGTLKDIVDYNPSTGTTSVVNHRRYDAFGNLKSQSGAVVVQFGYTGKFFDATTGFQNSWNRWYSPRIGRFLSQDPIGFDGGDINLYRYVGNTPTMATDPSGLAETWWEWLFGEGDPPSTPPGTSPFGSHGSIHLDDSYLNCDLSRVEGMMPRPIPTQVCHGMSGLGREGPVNSFRFSDPGKIEQYMIFQEFIANMAMSASELGAVRALIVRGPIIASSPKGIATPYGQAIQEQSAAALQVRTQIQQGAAVYKGGVFGNSETGASQFLATESPLNPGFAGRYGLPPGNSNFDFILGGRVRPGAPVVTRSAPGIPPNPGGGIEGVVNSGDFRIDWFHMPD